MTNTIEHPCKGMTKKQREAFERIATNQQPGATHKTLVALREAGLIDYTNRIVGQDALGKITVPEWFVPNHVHMQWCEWCAKNSNGG
jgi:hypothetical protein